MRVLIADRESDDRAVLINQCHSRGDLDNLIVVSSGAEAIEQIRAHRPDVALLACELADMTGFDVLRDVEDDIPPATIMIAPDDRYAAAALSTAATDYLTRPLSADRLALALKRAFSGTGRALRRTAAKRVPAVEKPAARYVDFLPLGYSDRLVGERAGRIYFLSPLNIDYIQADRNYVRIHVGKECFINRDSVTRLSPLLESFGFVRISRAILLNLRRVSFAQREGRGVLAFVLESGARVVSSAGFRLEAGAPLRVVRTRRTHGRSCAV